MNNPIDKILTEWAYRVHDGMPDPKNPYHLIKLDEAMISMKLPNDFRSGFLNGVRGVTEEYPLETKQIYLDNNFYEKLENELSEARIYQSKYASGDVFQITSDSGISVWKGATILNWDGEDYVDSGKVFDAKQVFTKQSKADPKGDKVGYVKIGNGGEKVTLKGDDGKIYVLDAAGSNLKLFSKAKSPTSFNWSAEALETAAGCGVYMDGATHVTKFLQYFQSKNVAAVGRQILAIKSEALSALGKGNFASKGVSELTSKADTADGNNWYMFALLAAGMGDFKHKNVGTTVVHEKITDYYKALQANELVDTSGGKANTADMILTNASSDDELISKIGDKNSHGSYRFIDYDSNGVCEILDGPTDDSKSTGIKFVQMSMKKAKGKAQLGKISNFVRDHFDMKDNKGYIIDFVGEKTDEGFFGKAFDKVKSIGKAVISKVTKLVVKIQNIGTKFFNKFKGKKGNKSDITGFFKKNKRFKSAAKKAIKEGIIDKHYISSGGLLLEKKGVSDLSFDDKLLVLQNDSKALNESVTMTQKKVNSLLKSSSPTSVTIKLQGTLAKNAKMSKADIYKLMSNYVSADFLSTMIKDGKDNVKPVKEILSDFALIEKEMIYGRSSLPLWKVYGRDQKGGSATHTSYPGSKEFVEETFGDLMLNTQNKIIFGTFGNLQSGNFYTFTVWMVSELNDAQQLIYTKFRIGTNGGDESFTWIFEGTTKETEDKVKKKLGIS